MLSSQKDRISFVQTDVTDESAVRALVDAAVDRYGKLDGAVNSAGISNLGLALDELSSEQFDTCINVNLRGMFLCMKYQIRAMKKDGGGSLVAIASTAGVKAIVNSSEYCASKAGVIGLVHGPALDFVNGGVRVNAILPGATLAPMAERVLKDVPDMQRIVETYPMKRFASPDEIAAGALWLISDAASYVTGAAIPIDGGLTS